MSLSQNLGYSNGIDIETGRYFFSDQPAATEIKLDNVDNFDKDWLGSNLSSRGIIEGVDPTNLAKAGWGIIFHRDATAELRNVMKPLQDHRKRAAGPLFREYSDESGFFPGDTASSFLRRNGVAPGPVNPMKMPYYLLIVGDPEHIPFMFQSHLDLQYGVGRLFFDEVDDYSRYIDSLLMHENRSDARRRQRVVFFGPRHDNDPCTQKSSQHLIKTLANEMTHLRPELNVNVIVDDAATRENLKYIFNHSAGDLIFCAGHGAMFKSGHARQHELQGSLVCGEWPGLNHPLNPSHMFTCADVPAEANLTGTILMQFSCFGAATPRVCSFGSGQAETRRELSKTTFISSLPKRLLSHLKGACLAVVAHVDRAFESAFIQGDLPHLETYATCLNRLAQGQTVGWSMEAFGMRYGELLGQLEEIRENQELFPDAHLKNDQVYDLLHEARDCRNFIVLGDPCVSIHSSRKMEGLHE